MRRAARGVTVIAGRGHVDTAPGSLAVDRPRVDLDRMVDQDVVLGGDVEVLVASAAGRGKVGRVDGGACGRRWQDVVLAVAVRALRHVFAGAEPRSAVRLIFLIGLANVLFSKRDKK